MKLNDPVNISTKRTAVNITVIAFIASLVSRIFNVDVNLTAEDMAILAPVLGVLFGIGYRLSRWATAKWPSLGWVLFGSGKEPEGIKEIGS